MPCYFNIEEKFNVDIILTLHRGFGMRMLYLALSGLQCLKYSFTVFNFNSGINLIY